MMGSRWPKRTRKGLKQQQQQQQQQQAALRTIDIPCHANILAARSSYFAAALQGGFLESQKKVVELQVADEQAVVDLKLLLKLSYSGSYIYYEDVLLDLQTRIRLVILADALEFRECVDAIFSSFVVLSTSEEALARLEEMTEELQDHQGMAALVNKVIE